VNYPNNQIFQVLKHYQQVKKNNKREIQKKCDGGIHKINFKQNVPNSIRNKKHIRNNTPIQRFNDAVGCQSNSSQS